MACPAPHCHDGVHAELQETAAPLAAHLAPRTGAYHEIWLNGKSHQRTAETLAASRRRAALRQGLPAAQVQDRPGAAGGQLHRRLRPGPRPAGHRRGRPDRRLQRAGRRRHGHDARQRQHLPAPGQADLLRRRPSTWSTAAEAVVKLFRDHGNRADRKRARIKYLVHDWGVEKFREVLSEYIGGATACSWRYGTGHLGPALDLRVLAGGEHRVDVVRAPRPQPHPAPVSVGWAAGRSPSSASGHCGRPRRARRASSGLR